MKVGYFADGPWSHKALELLVNEVEIAFIVPRFDTQDPVLKQWAEKLKVPYFPVEDVNSKDFIDWAKETEADLFVSMSFNQILKKEIINLPKYGFINCHAGALPFYRGRNPLNWVLINGESHFGITVHYVDEGIDTGDIISQKLYEITNVDDYASLLEKAVIECASLLLNAVSLIKASSVSAIVQSSIHPVGTYFGRRINGDELVDFSWGAQRFFNFVRAITSPGPGARCKGPNGELALLECRLIDSASSYIATEGEVVGKNDDGVVIKVGDSTVLLTKIADVRQQGLGEIKKPTFGIGTRLKGR
ncbi:methionyl-tRNA formyltransferase [Oceanisphaera arctica]|uniref:Formyl transferase n=1 Tax=Oceanisphaera arctica TaxID=641510 RepID=A0A2P5TK86_9GAMM|nr:formyltransferase family protein [Oceanisphaera arctica]PPL15529.1 formyl transferase [Oceanisphaera arctica]GHA27670.1 methionyl-tRNA formyltransferase [Oceanisphaera arctica]